LPPVPFPGEAAREPGRGPVLRLAGRIPGRPQPERLLGARGVQAGRNHVHGTEHNADLIKSSRMLCTTCHGPKSPNGPRAATIEAHTHHQRGSAGGECVACHMPSNAQTIADVNVRSHTFRFVTPAMTEALKIPNPCTSCHKDKTNAWATEALRS